MPERCGHEPLAVLPHHATLAAAHDARLLLEVGERPLPCFLVRLAHFTADLLVVGERVEQADALRAGEDEVVAGHRGEPLLLLPPLARVDVESANRDRALTHRLSQPLRVRRVGAAQQGAEVAVLDDADQAEPRGSAAGPDPRRLAATGVVVVQPAGDLLLVVGLVAQRQLRDAQHRRSPRDPKGARTHMHPRCARRAAFTARATLADHLMTTREAAESCSGP